MVDSLFTGEFSIDRANQWGDEKVGNFVLKVANHERERSGKSKFTDLTAAIHHLEQNHGMAADEAANTFGGGYYHHFRDFSHHFSPVGLGCSLFTQFTEGKAIGTDVYGKIIISDVSKSTLLGKNFEEKIMYGAIEWFLHLVSDMAGSSGNPGGGTGIPGPLLSMLKELSALPIFRESKPTLEKNSEDVDGFRAWLSKLFTGTLLGKRDENGKITEKTKFDLRTEIGILHEVGRQFVPVIINECLVRASYFIRRLYLELTTIEVHAVADLRKINGSKLLPFNNAAVRRMVTVSSGTLVAVDASDAFARSLLKNKTVKSEKFWIDFAVRINIVGVGRFAVACVVDIRASAQESKWEKLSEETLSDEFGKEIAGMANLSLSFPQYQILCSLEKLMLDYDIRLTKNKAEIKSKTIWRNSWIEDTLEPIPLVGSNKELFFFSAKQMFDAIEEESQESSDLAWLHLVLTEAALFDSYEKNVVKDEEWKKKGALKHSYIQDIFCPSLKEINENEFKELRKAKAKYEAKLSGSTQKKVFSVMGTGVVVVATGGAAAYFAPAIAPALAAALFGETVAGLSGAALTSASLAAFGGGALAAGGLGMAGGTAVIAGGGALLGLAGGSGATTLASIQVLSSEEYVLDECSKLLAFSDVVLAGELSQPAKISAIIMQLEAGVNDLRESLDNYKTDDATDKEGKKKAKLLKVAEKSLGYMVKTCELLKKQAIGSA